MISIEAAWKKTVSDRAVYSQNNGTSRPIPSDIHQQNMKPGSFAEKKTNSPDVKFGIEENDENDEEDNNKSRQKTRRLRAIIPRKRDSHCMERSFSKGGERGGEVEELMDPDSRSDYCSSDQEEDGDSQTTTPSAAPASRHQSVPLETSSFGRDINNKRQRRLSTLSALDLPERQSAAELQAEMHQRAASSSSATQSSPEAETPDSASTERTLFTPIAGAVKGLRRDDPRILRDVLDALNYLDALDDRQDPGDDAASMLGPFGRFDSSGRGG